MAFDIALGAVDHDLFITEEGDFLLIDDAERVAQQIKITLLTMLGEWFLDTSHGIPYLERILVKNPNLQLIKSIFRDKISNIPDVKKVNKLNLVFDRVGRNLRVNFEVESTYGLITRREMLQYGR